VNVSTAIRFLSFVEKHVGAGGSMMVILGIGMWREKLDVETDNIVWVQLCAQKLKYVARLRVRT
jgi:hypothetical protein